jgi:hypothetical protein
MQLVAAVHDYDFLAVEDLLLNPTHLELRGICVALAAMIDPDARPSELLRWNDTDPTADLHVITATPTTPRRHLRPHGTHAAYVRHKSHGERPCEKCVEAERTYQCIRGRRRRAEAAAS